MNIKRIYIILSLLLLSVAYNARAGQPEQLYADKQYDKALELLKNSEKAGSEYAALYCDMANCYYHLDDYASAVLYYHKALALDPYMSEAQNNLKYVRQKVEDRNHAAVKDSKKSVTPEEASAFKKIYRFIALDNSSNMWAYCALGCFVLFCVCLLLYVISRNVTLKKVGFFTGIPVLLASVVLLIFAFMASDKNRFGKTAIVNEVTLSLKADPTVDATDTGLPLVKGTELQIIEQRTAANGDKWSLLRLNADIEGWAKDNTFLLFE